MKQLLLVCLIGLILLSANGVCYIIDGDRAIEEGNGAKIVITPHTATSPTNKFRQQFSFENLSGLPLSNVTPVLFFSDNPKVSLQKLTKAVYETVEKSESFDLSQLEWSQEESNDPNAHFKIKIWQNIDDENGYSATITLWEQNVQRIETCAGQPEETVCFYWSEKQLVTKKGWTNQNIEFFGETEINDESVWYYYGNEFNIEQGETIDWKINYSPKKAEGKWTLAFVQGTPECLVNDSCSGQWVLDPWWENSEWGYRKKITLKTSDYLSADVSNDHAILVEQTASDIDFWDNVDSMGEDVRFVSESSLTEYEYHFEEWNYSNKNMVAWVKVTDTFTYDDNLDFYMYYRNPSSFSTQDESATYSSNIRIVHHMSEDSSPQHDSTSYDNDAIKNGNVNLGEPGKISGGNNFFNEGKMKIASNPSLNLTEKATVKLWFKSTDTINSTYVRYLFSKGDDLYAIMYNWTPNRVSAYFRTETNGTELPANVEILDGKWHQVVATYNSSGTGNQKIYIDGVNVGQLTEIGKIIITETDAAFGGHPISPSRNFTGFMDELLVSAAEWSADEVKLIYRSENRDLQIYGNLESNDSDGDGVMDINDECPATPQGEVVDVIGCSCSQKTCDDGNPCSDDVCDWNSAECVFANDNTNVCGFERDCTGSTCILKETPPYFYWKLFPDDGHDYCYDGNCMQYSCDLVSEDFNATCSFANTSELEAKVEEMEGKITQLEQQNLDLQGQMNILEASLSAMQNAFESFVSIVDSYILSLPIGLRQGMVCQALEQSGELSTEGFGLSCRILQNGNCKCVQV